MYRNTLCHGDIHVVTYETPDARYLPIGGLNMCPSGVIWTCHRDGCLWWRFNNPWSQQRSGFAAKDYESHANDQKDNEFRHDISFRRCIYGNSAA